MFATIRHWLDRRIIKRSPITADQWSETFAALPLLKGLSEQERQRLQELAILFMHQKVFEGVRGLEVTRKMAVVIALQACLPILNLGLAAYEGWVSIIVYPAGFAPQHEVTDEYGVVHFQQSNLSGEAWQRGPVVLDWNEAETAAVIDGHNLLIHEFAHKLDMQNGAANGFPPLHAGMKTEAWEQDFSEAYAHFQHHCKSHSFHGIDCYAATSPAEFFAVLSEVFFERPAVLQPLYPAIYQQLCLYYRQDPITRLGEHA